jgi:hypothetical protein
LSCSAVENPDLNGTGFVDVSKVMDIATWSKYKGFAHTKLDKGKLDDFQVGLQTRFEKTFDAKMDK